MIEIFATFRLFFLSLTEVHTIAFPFLHTHFASGMFYLSDSAQSPYGAELEQRNKPLQNGIGQDDHLKNQDGLEITVHEAMPRDEAGTTKQ